MLTFYGKKLFRLTSALSYMAGQLDVIEKANAQQKDVQLGVKFEDDFHPNVAMAVQVLCQELESLGLQFTHRAAIRLENVLKEKRIDEYRSHFQNVQERLHDELETVELLLVPANMAAHYSSADLWIGAEVITNFPTAALEAEEACKCYALNRSTACVFHMMRILELGLNALAQSLQVQFDRRNWENIIGDIEAEIRRISTSRGPSWKEDEQFYAEAAIQFRYFKNAWRNHVMHIRDVYSEEKSLEIMNHVRDFMKHLSKKIQEVP